MKIVIFTLLWAIPLNFSITYLLRLYLTHNSLVISCISFSMGILGYLITKKLVK
jgi:hypothetical protein